MKKREFWASLFWAVLGLVIAFKCLEYKVGTLRQPEPGFLPFWAGIGIFFLSLYSMTRSFKPGTSMSPFFSEEGGLRRVLTTFTLLAAYILLVGKLGFLISTFFLMGLLLKSIYPQSWLKTVTFSVFVSVLSYFVFGHWLQVQLPRGWMGF